MSKKNDYIEKFLNRKPKSKNKPDHPWGWKSELNQEAETYKVREKNHATNKIKEQKSDW